MAMLQRNLHQRGGWLQTRSAWRSAAHSTPLRSSGGALHHRGNGEPKTHARSVERVGVKLHRRVLPEKPRRPGRGASPQWAGLPGGGAPGGRGSQTGVLQ
ncbi:hypothetical protein EYF80_061825 [Liparis tanakae]|uniref:Uncharacterized protein n=1 Tax=Liparis tanakae TaxID=230148 RepID=A0A4Z2EGZ0_9TELE|nr:hypothetical protein EYF80_061825 [Liparis tanakae]